MASIDIGGNDYRRTHFTTAEKCTQIQLRPRTDALGLALFVFHLAVGGYLIFGWMVPAAKP